MLGTRGRYLSELSNLVGYLYPYSILPKDQEYEEPFPAVPSGRHHSRTIRFKVPNWKVTLAFTRAYHSLLSGQHFTCPVKMSSFKGDLYPLGMRPIDTLGRPASL